MAAASDGPTISGALNPFDEYMSDSDDDSPSSMASGLDRRASAFFTSEPSGAHSDLTGDEKELLSKLERENKRLEEDRKAATTLSAATHLVPIGVNLARRASGTSLVSSNSNSNVASSTEDPNSAESSLEEDRWSLWGKIVNDWDSYRKKTAFVKELVRHGIPRPFRGLAWQLISGAYDSGSKELYSEYMKQTSPCEKIIRRDIARTYPENDFFREKDGLGQESLFNVMKAYSLHDREVGYCQGSAFIVGLLLMQMPEEEAFAVLVQLMQRFQLRELFKPSMQELGLSMHQLDSLVQEQLPDLHAHFTQQNFHTTMYASPWFLTLFATSLPQDLAARVMDLILAEGTIFIFQMGMAILRMSALDLMALDMEQMIRFFQKEVPQQAESDGLESLVQSALGVKISAKKMKKWEKEYLQIKSKEHEELVELRRLRTENKLLKQRIVHLEKESAALADRLIQGQVTRAQEAEELFVLRRDLASAKQQGSDAAGELARTKEELEKLSAKHVGKAAFETEASEMIKALQVELMAIRLKEAESDHSIKELETKLEETLEANRELQEGPNGSIASLQDELTAVKLREAEANLSLKEMKQKVLDLEHQWKNYINSVEGVTIMKEGSKAEKKEMIKIQEDLMLAKLNENSAAASAKDHRQRLMEMETQNQVLANQLRRQDDEITRLKDRVVEKSSSERSLRHNILEFRHQVSDLESKLREENMMGRIKEAEHHQIVGDLQRKVAELESKHLELVTSGQLSLHEADANDASLAALSFLAREERSDGAGVSQQGALRGKEADAAALEEEIEQMRVNERVEARLLQDSSSRGRRFNGDRSALELGVVDEDEEDDDVELKAVLNSTFKEARHELENLLFPDEKARDLENQLLLATDVLSNKSSARCSFNHKTFDTPGRLPTDNLFEASAPPDKMGTVEQSIHSAHLRSAAQADVASNSSQETSRVLSRNDSNVGLDVELLLAGIGASCDAGNSRSPSVASSDTFQPIVTNIKAPS